MMLPWNKRKYFVQNGGLLLDSYEDGALIKQLSIHQLNQATNNFSKKNIIEAGDQGTVYKGTLKGGTAIAVKLCNKIEKLKTWTKGTDIEDGDEPASRFISELALISKIFHNNIVYLLGCCLESEVPMLVFERHMNGDLAHHLHKDEESKDGDTFVLSWETRLKIALETAEGLSYLHRQTVDGIFHRDVKTENILLDNSCTAKLANLGVSQTAGIRGTPGYMDPEYMETGRYTAKSDVYSFGVVLAELLTGRRPVYSYMSRETYEENVVILADYFKTLETEKIMGTFLDVHVKLQGKKKEVEAVIDVAKRCLESEGRNRPKMRDVEIALETIRSKQVEDYYAEEVEECDYESSAARPLRHQSSDDDAWRPTDSAPPAPKIHQQCGPSEATVADEEMTSHESQEPKASESVKGQKQSKPRGQSVWKLVGQRTV